MYKIALCLLCTTLGMQGFAGPIIKPVPPLVTKSFDTESDQRIQSVINATEFNNTMVNYRHMNKTYEIYVVRNPHNQLIWAVGLSDPISCPLAISSLRYIPQELKWHIEDLIPDALKNSADTLIDLSDRRKLMPSVYAGLHPIVYAERVDDPYFDADIRAAFSSIDCVNKVYHYYLNGRFYNVRIMHNPEVLYLTAKKTFTLSGRERSMEVPFNYKYGLFTDRVAPQELIDHVSSLITGISYWDWYFNYQIQNGTLVQYEERDYLGANTTRITTYDLDTWFEFLEDPRP